MDEQPQEVVAEEGTTVRPHPNSVVVRQAKGPTTRMTKWDRPIEWDPKKAPLTEKTHFTTGEISKLLRCAPRTVTKWIDAGKFPGSFKLPGSWDRRVPRESVLAFCREHQMQEALALLEPWREKPEVWVVGLSAARLGEVCGAVLVPDLNRGIVWATDDLFDAGLRMATAVPGVLIVHSSLGRAAVFKLINKVWEETKVRHKYRPQPKVLVVYPDEFPETNSDLPAEVRQCLESQLVVIKELLE